MANNAVITWETVNRIQNAVTENTTDISNMDMSHQLVGYSSKDYGKKLYNIKDVNFLCYRHYYLWPKNTDYFAIPAKDFESPGTEYYVVHTDLEIDNYSPVDKKYVQYSVIIDHASFKQQDNAGSIGVIVRDKAIDQDIKFFLNLTLIKFQNTKIQG